MERQNTQKKTFVSDGLYLHLINLMQENGDTEIQAVKKLESWKVDTYPL